MRHQLILLEEHPLEHSDRLLAHGHSHRVPDGHWDGASRRIGSHPQVHAHRGPMRADLESEAIRRVHEPRSCNDQRWRKLLRSEVHDGEIWHQFIFSYNWTETERRVLPTSQPKEPQTNISRFVDQQGHPMFPVQRPTGERFHDSNWESDLLLSGWWLRVCKMRFEHINGVMQKAVIDQQDWENPLSQSQETNHRLSFAKRSHDLRIHENCQ